MPHHRDGPDGRCLYCGEPALPATACPARPPLDTTGVLAFLGWEQEKNPDGGE